MRPDICYRSWKWEGVLSVAVRFRVPFLGTAHWHSEQIYELMQMGARWGLKPSQITLMGSMILTPLTAKWNVSIRYDCVWILHLCACEWVTWSNKTHWFVPARPLWPHRSMCSQYLSCQTIKFHMALYRKGRNGDARLLLGEIVVLVCNNSLFLWKYICFSAF